jgi:hypothetical protein
MTITAKYIERVALRIARLAALQAPAIILADQTNLLLARVEAYCAPCAINLADERKRKAELMAEIDAQGPLSIEEEAEMSAEEAAYDKAAEKAQKLSGYSDLDWSRLDSNYRFGLVMDQYEEPASAIANEGK